MNSSSARVEGVGRDALGLDLVEHAEVGVDPGAERVARRMRAQSPWIVETHALSAARASSRRPSSRKRRRTRLFISAAAFSVNVIASTCSTPDAVLGHGAHEALDEHGGLAGAGAGAHEQRAVAALDRPRLLGRELPHRSLLHTDGYLQPPFQSQRSGRAHQLAAAHERVGLADPLERPVQLRPGSPRGRAGRSENQRSPSSSTSFATMPRGRGSSLPSAT